MQVDHRCLKTVHKAEGSSLQVMVTSRLDLTTPNNKAQKLLVVVRNSRRQQTQRQAQRKNYLKTSSWWNPQAEHQSSWQVGHKRGILERRDEALGGEGARWTQFQVIEPPMQRQQHRESPYRKHDSLKNLEDCDETGEDMHIWVGKAPVHQ